MLQEKIKQTEEAIEDAIKAISETLLLDLRSFYCASIMNKLINVFNADAKESITIEGLSEFKEEWSPTILKVLQPIEIGGLFFEEAKKIHTALISQEDNEFMEKMKQWKADPEKIPLLEEIKVTLQNKSPF